MKRAGNDAIPRYLIFVVFSVSRAVTRVAGCAIHSLLLTAQLPFDPACGPPAKILS